MVKFYFYDFVNLNHIFLQNILDFTNEANEAKRNKKSSCVYLKLTAKYKVPAKPPYW